MATIYTVLGSSLMLEWAADQPSTIYEDTGGTDAAEDGDPVASWRSTANGSLSLLSNQSTLANRPAYRANYAASGYPAIEFDGSNDGLFIPHNAALSITNQTIFIVAKADTLSAWRILLSKVGNPSWTTGIHVAAYSATQLNFIANGALLGTVLPDTSSRFILAMRYNGVSGEIWLNDTAIGAATTSLTVTANTADGGIGNGGSAGGPYPWDGAIQHILWCSGACSRTAMEYIVNALGDRWGISITDPPSIGGGVTGFTGLSGLTGRLGT
jgi:hypothetical protein